MSLLSDIAHYDACIYMDRCILFQATMNFFRKTLKKDLSAEGQLEFLNMWYIMIIVNDVLIILGSAIKEQIERQVRCNIDMLYM
jgi:mucolipin